MEYKSALILVKELTDKWYDSNLTGRIIKLDQPLELYYRAVGVIESSGVSGDAAKAGFYGMQLKSAIIGLDEFESLL